MPSNRLQYVALFLIGRDEESYGITAGASERNSLAQLTMKPITGCLYPGSTRVQMLCCELGVQAALSHATGPRGSLEPLIAGMQRQLESLTLAPSGERRTRLSALAAAGCGGEMDAQVLGGSAKATAPAAASHQARAQHTAYRSK